ncbi:MAG: hypothetical protein N3E37_05605, partial [Candidatus Micrarchaeota archaeon]|nr:hypothetical protein [Candidatus Micrarchaeota archaeon]
MKKDLLLTSFVEFLILASGLLVYRLASQNLGSQGFSEYALTRRVISLIQPALILGMGVGIPRYIAYSYKDKKESDTFFIAGSFIIFSIALLSFLILNLFSESFAYIFFSYKNYHNLIFPVSLILIGLLLHALCYAYFRGSLKMLNANTLQLVNMSFVPIFSFFLSRSLEQILIYNGLLMIITSLSFYIPIFFHIKKEFTDIKKKVKTLLSYGLQRLPADFG